MERTKVICDSNVWYRLGAKGPADTNSELKDCDLYMTSLTIQELASTEHINSDFDLIKHCFYAVTKHSYRVLSQNDAQQILLANDTNYRDHACLPQQKAISGIVKDFVDADTKDKLSYIYNDMITEKKQVVSNWVQKMETLVEWMRTQHNKLKRDISFDSIVEDGFIREHIKDYLERNNPDYQLNHFNTDKLVLFKEALKKYLESFLSEKNKKVHENDYIDYMNLLYCIDDFKYLTCDKKVNKYLNPNYLLPNNDEIVKKLLKE